MARRRTPTPEPTASVKRRDFLKAAGLGASALIVGEAAPLLASTPAPVPTPRSTFPAVTPPSLRVAVIGAGSFGVWTAYHLRKLGAAVTLVDTFGPGNSRSTSGDETRGVRSSYGDKAAPVGELWSHWARLAMRRWPDFDAEWGPVLKTKMFFKTGDLYMRSDWEPTIKRSREIWEKAKVPFEVLTAEECHYRWPQMNYDGIQAVLFEPDAGVVRARRAVQGVASVLTRGLGVKLVIAKAKPGAIVNHRMSEIALINGDKIHADAFVFACGPWLGKVFPELLGDKIRTPLGQVVYYAPPVDSNAYTFPNMPSYNFPGVTGWVALPEDSRGFRVRGTESGAGAGGGTGGGRGGAGAGAAAGAGGAAVDSAGRGAAGGRGAGGGRGRGGAGGAPPATADTAGRGAARGAAGAPPVAGAAGDSSGRGAARGGAAGGAAGGAGAGRGGAAGGGTASTPDPQQDPDHSTRWFDAVTNTRQRDFVNHRFPGMKDAPISETRCCHYEGTSSRNFIIDLIPECHNAWIAGGGNSEAFKSGPVIGDYVAKRVLGMHTDPEIDRQFRIPTEGFTPADTGGARGGRGTAADSAGRGGRGGRGATADSSRGGRGGSGAAADTTAGRGARGATADTAAGRSGGRRGRGGGGGGGE